MAEEIANRLQKEHELFIAMSHELRTPLARMRVAVEMLDDEEMQAVMLRSLQAMEELIETLMLRERTQQTNQDVTQIIDQRLVESWLQQDFSDALSSIQLKWSQQPLSTDGFALRLILKNLIANALKYGEQQPITVGMKPMDQGIEIWVEDQGIGLSEQELTHLFEPFYRADKARARQTGVWGWDCIYHRPWQSVCALKSLSAVNPIKAAVSVWSCRFNESVILVRR